MIRLTLAVATSKLFRLFGPVAVLAVGLLAGIAFADDGAAAAQPAWLTLVLGLAPTLVACLLGLHLLHHLAIWLRADAAKRTGLVAKVESVAADESDDLDDYLSANGQSVKDLLDPTKRAAAEVALKTQAGAQVKKMLDDAVKEVLPGGTPNP